MTLLSGGVVMEIRFRCYSELSVARRNLAINSTSTASERLFSLAGNIVTKKWNWMKPSSVDMMTRLSYNLKKNSHILGHKRIIAIYCHTPPALAPVACWYRPLAYEYMNYIWIWDLLADSESCSYRYYRIRKYCLHGRYLIYLNTVFQWCTLVWYFDISRGQLQKQMNINNCTRSPSLVCGGKIKIRLIQE